MYTSMAYRITSQTQTLPTNIELDILLKLPIKTLCRFKSVSTQWFALITQPQFIKSHLLKSNNNSQQVLITTHESLDSLDFRSPNDPYKKFKNVTNKQPVDIIGSCYGLLLVLMYDRDQFCGKKYSAILWNPSTRVYRNIPLPGYLDVWDIYGLSYDSSGDDFKIVMVIYRDANTKSPVHAFSSRIGSWKRIQDFLLLKLAHNLKNNVVLDGVLYWIAVSYDKSVIVYFDPKEDKMKELPSPEHHREIELTVSGGNLCVFTKYGDLNIWVMNSSSWIKILALSSSDFFLHKVPGYHSTSSYVRPLCLTGENEVAIESYRNIVIFNMKENTFKLIESPSCFKYGYKYHNAVSYVESLVSPYVGFGTRS